MILPNQIDKSQNFIGIWIHETIFATKGKQREQHNRKRISFKPKWRPFQTAKIM